MQHWTAYWQKTKTLNSFAEGEQSLGYTGSIAEFWCNTFQQLAPGCKVLDLATGNGALAVLALETNSDLSLTASDAAAISPLTLFNEQDALYSLLCQIQFVANMPSVQLSFPDSTFDSVVSQFGFEYAAVEPALKQILRVLKPGGKFVALIHHADSFITEDCRIGIDMLKRFLSKDSVLYYVNQYIVLCEALAKFDNLSAQQLEQLKQHSDKLRFMFIDLQQQLNIEQRDWFNLLIQDVIVLFQDWRKANLAALINLTQNFADYLARLEDQVESAWGLTKVQQVKRLAADFDLEFSIDVLSQDGQILCWALELQKRK